MYVDAKARKAESEDLFQIGEGQPFAFHAEGGVRPAQVGDPKKREQPTGCSLTYSY